MSILLDASAYSALMRGDGRAIDLVRTADRMAPNAVIVGELLSGFAAGTRETRNRRLFRDFVASPRVTIVAMGYPTAERFADVHRVLRQAGTPIPTHDMWIAASAMEHDLTLVTSDRHFVRIPNLPAEFVALAET
ncbi:MAG: type II toxin-antitoxin system VapC family toxin [Chloroflexota bacterium]|nr:MAG: type II toxin-antitoxin system VapC family toxin [Chloroflexota bacterium]